MEAFGLLLGVPLMLLNLLAGLVGGVGLLIQGEWSLFFGGIAYAIAGPFILSIAMLPGMIFAPLAVMADERRRPTLAVFAAIPSLIWTYIVVSVSCVIAFSTVVSNSDGGFFHLLWGYSTATAPWSFMAQKDRQSGNDASTTLMLFVQLGTIALMVRTFLSPMETDVGSLMPWFMPFMGLGVAAQLFLAWAESRNRRYRGF